MKIFSFIYFFFAVWGLLAACSEDDDKLPTGIGENEVPLIGFLSERIV